MKILVTAAALCIFLSASWISAQVVRGNPKAGEAIYAQHCVRCHGEQLDGNGPEAPYLIVRPANFHSQASRFKTDWELLVTISNGVLFTPMHGFRGKLTDDQMLDVLAYIRSVVPVDQVS